jgi:hypothetical protein
MMLELQRSFPVDTPIGYGWVIIVSRESGLANDIWTCAMERDGAICHFRSDQISALPNGTLDIKTKTQPCNTTTTTEARHSRARAIIQKLQSGLAPLKSKAKTTRSASGSKRAAAAKTSSR